MMTNMPKSRLMIIGAMKSEIGARHKSTASLPFTAREQVIGFDLPPATNALLELIAVTARDIGPADSVLKYKASHK